MCMTKRTMMDRTLSWVDLLCIRKTAAGHQSLKGACIENEGEGDADNDKEGMFNADKDDDNASDTQAQHCIVATKLSGASKQPLTFHNNKVARTPCISATAIEALEALMASDGETVKLKKTRDKHSAETVTCEPKTVENAIEHAGPKRQHEIGVEDVNLTTVKAQKLTDHEGHPCAKDYDDVTQEFMTAAIGDYCACLCAQSPIPNHGKETMLLAASWMRLQFASPCSQSKSEELGFSRVTQRGYKFCIQGK
ncbi:hypothetical protein F5J12DRAFT_779770 [Pisolithus orientalis]|uniref:uncharacterized protein n=1 Tax=Pisolithus orientalis TaxID=936130 RepID=UPI002224E59D|nr:uncharacterized protein F5J12DRAFT_779770 [Pisolithus orientalis]KAI6030675.1 hypothetical protein F5J12DRAFT_779770 [Pisolithus orientalis]